MGLMKYSGMFNSIGYSGYTTDIMKSALQKYIRRNIVERALLAARDMYRMGEIGGKSIVTNLYNRLIIIACEDIAIANTNLVIAIIKEIYNDEVTRDSNLLACIVTLLCQSSKTRLGSHLWCAYGTDKGRKITTTLNVALGIIKKITGQFVF